MDRITVTTRTIIPKISCCFFVHGCRCLRIMPPKKVSEFIISEKEKSLYSYITSNNYLFMTQEMRRNSVVLENL
ncbi:unknown protein [Streptococcus thermophilus CNRZ1066]|nr:unknown protein [Streptococcus thermophilus CNRZ1066]